MYRTTKTHNRSLLLTTGMPIFIVLPRVAPHAPDGEHSFIPFIRYTDEILLDRYVDVACGMIGRSSVVASFVDDIFLNRPIWSKEIGEQGNKTDEQSMYM